MLLSRCRLVSRLLFAIFGATLFFASFMAAPAVAAYSGSYNFERMYINGDRGELYIERTPRLVYNPNAPGSIEPNGWDWMTNMYKYKIKIGQVRGVSIYEYIYPKEVHMTVYIKDLTSSSGAQYWGLNRWWPISSAEHGQTIQWSWSISGGGEYLQGGISATLAVTPVSSITYDYTKQTAADGWTRLGGLNVIFSKDTYTQRTVWGGFKLWMYNDNGQYVNNHQFQVKIDCTLVWKCTDSLHGDNHKRSYTGTMINGDSTSGGDWWIYVRTGDSSGS